MESAKMNENDGTNLSVTSRKSHRSKVSKVSSRASSSSSILSKKLELKMEEAVLKATLVFDEEKKRLKSMLKALEIKRRLAANQAKQAVIEEFEEELSEHESDLEQLEIEGEDKSKDMQRFLDSQNTDATPPPCLEAGKSPMINYTSSGLEKIAVCMEKCVRQLAETVTEQSKVNQCLAVSAQLPKVDVPTFSGDPLSFPLWKNTFDTMIDSKPLDNATKLSLLYSHISGKPKELVEHYMLIGSENAYDKARDDLARRYGNASIVSTAFTSKLNSWSRISSRDATGLQDFADFLTKVDTAKKSVRSLGILDFPQENAKLVDKLPQHLESRWRDEIDKFKEEKGAHEYPPFSVFVEFVRRAADRANIPELSGLTREQPRSTSMRQDRHARTFTTNVKPSKPTEQNQSTPACPYCAGTCSHWIEECTNFMEITVEERRCFFFDNKLCFGCALSNEHQSKDCKDRRSCAICNCRHLSCFHS